MRLPISFIFLALFALNTSWGQSFLEISKDLDQHIVYTSIEEALTNPEEVYRLNLNNSEINENLLEESLHKFINLRDLKLSNTFISQIPSSIGHLRKLQFLEVGHLKEQNLNLFKIPESIQKLKEIVYINLIGNPNLEWDETFLCLSKLPKLINIALMNNNYKKIPKEVTALSSLEMIWLGKNPNLDLEDAFSKLSRLDHLGQMGLGGNGHTQLPKEIVLLKNIHNLWLSGNNWKSLNGLQHLPKLSQLSLHNCNLSVFPKELIQCTKLEYLSFLGNPMMDFDEVLKVIPPSVKTLNLSDNNINNLSLDALGAISLEKLILNKNNIDERDLKEYRKANKNLEILHN
ncbi:MAG: hypothetical protein DHS20C18_54610 [Saprospiraceae bacterium]|nr:MAG: hypothetical protein DHS20C18_54610 [Saprospiraceae bacterium]